MGLNDPFATYGVSGSLFRRSIFHLGASVAGGCATATKPTNILLMFKAEKIVTARRITAIPTKYLNRAAMTICALKTATRLRHSRSYNCETIKYPRRTLTQFIERYMTCIKF